MAFRQFGDRPDEVPPWIATGEVAQQWDLAFGSYGDGYLEWVHNRYYWDIEAERTVADTRRLWETRARQRRRRRISRAGMGPAPTGNDGRAKTRPGSGST